MKARQEAAEERAQKKKDESERNDKAVAKEHSQKTKAQEKDSKEKEDKAVLESTRPALQNMGKLSKRSRSRHQKQRLLEVVAKLDL